MESFNLENICRAAADAKKGIGCLNTNEKNEALLSVADALVKNEAVIIEANMKDMENGRQNGMKSAILDRLFLNGDRIEAMAKGLRKVAGLPDPIGEVMDMSKRPNGMTVGKRRVPIGVIGIIYEARPNVTSTRAIVNIIRKALESCNIDANAVTLIESADRSVTKEFMKMNKYVDLLIPRGSAGLIRATMENSTIPVIETGTGNCHVYVDKDADINMALNILVNAKTQRIGVCNACESLVIHRNIIGEFLPKAVSALKEHNVEIRGDKEARDISGEIVSATDEDFYTEYLDYIISVRTVGSVEEAIDHINEHNTKHSETIITENYETACKFLDEIDAACVYVNASTRFTDGEEFGFGAEIGISTQKLHARGPMGLRELTTYKYVIYGNGQIRN